MHRCLHLFFIRSFSIHFSHILQWILFLRNLSLLLKWNSPFKVWAMRSLKPVCLICRMFLDEFCLIVKKLAVCDTYFSLQLARALTSKNWPRKKLPRSSLKFSEFFPEDLHSDFLQYSGLKSQDLIETLLQKEGKWENQNQNGVCVFAPERIRNTDYVAQSVVGRHLLNKNGICVQSVVYVARGQPFNDKSQLQLHVWHGILLSLLHSTSFHKVSAFVAFIKPSVLWNVFHLL